MKRSPSICGMKLRPDVVIRDKRPKIPALLAGIIGAEGCSTCSHRLQSGDFKATLREFLLSDRQLMNGGQCTHRSIQKLQFYVLFFPQASRKKHKPDAWAERQPSRPPLLCRYVVRDKQEATRYRFARVYLTSPSAADAVKIDMW